ncbi:hypothetical protein LJY25_00100 [Hymenobacter sp. BT175]|uniref:hypothetical protein n=1 Tax=Hymenobacter translucens TaxID=2886507 RepID=UPI001D0DEBAF|nr:hypothetical protein [Hymenobacter translucens]MCC2544830.1 hypothetical protein [Hymenobacter translucens]
MGRTDQADGRPAAGMSRVAGPLPLQFFLALGLGLLLLAALGLTLVFGPGSYADIDHLRHLRYHDGTFRTLPVALSPAGYQNVKLGLLALVGVLGLVTAWGFRTGGWLRQEVGALRREHRAAPSLLAPWHALPRKDKATALGLLGLLLLVRGYYLAYYPLYGDEVVSYLSFVREGPVAALSYYPIPNNHILYSVLCWLFSQLSSNVYFAMRLPTLLISTVGTALVGLLLLPRTGFQVTALTVFLFAFFPYSLFQAVVGRGYFLLAFCSQVALVAALALLNNTDRPRRAWTVLVCSAVAGLYAMPTFLLIFGALFGSLGLSFIFQRQWSQLGQLIPAGLVTGITTLLLYAPVLVVSGAGALFANGYVAPGAGSTPDLTGLSYVLRTEGQLLGAGPLGALLSVSISLAALFSSRRRRGSSRHLVFLALGLLWVPYLLLAARGIFPPARVLSFRIFFLLLPAALLYEQVLTRWVSRPAFRHPALALGLPVVAWALLGLRPFHQRALLEGQRNARVASTYSWLRHHGARRVLTLHPHYQLYLTFFSQQDRANLRVDASRQPGVSYDYQLTDKETSPAPPAQPALFENEDVRVKPLR